MYNNYPNNGMNPQQPMNNGMQQPMNQPPMNQQPMNQGVPPYQQQPMNNGMAPQYGTAPKKNNMPLIIGAVAAVVVVIVVVVLMNGGKKLECSYEMSYSGMTMKQTQTYTYDKDGKKIKKATATVSLTAPDSTSDSDMNTLLESAQSECDEYKDVKGVSCKASKSGKTITEKITVDVSKVSDEDSDIVGIEQTALEDFKKELEEEGYTCK